MPTRTLKRLWCKTCNEFKVHEIKLLSDNEWSCNNCGTEYSEILLKDIPSNKIMEQRERYKIWKHKVIDGMFSKNLLSGIFMPIFDSMNSENEIQESDAGQIAIDTKKRKVIEIEREKSRQIRAENLKLKESYHKLGRNDICLCGSGLKYKKCCYSKINKIY